MPLYEYRCQACSKQVEVIQSFSDKPLSKCETCGGKLEKLISRSGFVLKGSGWYASDYKTKPAAGGKSFKSDDGATTTASDASAPADAGGKADAKPDAKPGAKPAAKSLAGASKD